MWAGGLPILALATVRGVSSFTSSLGGPLVALATVGAVTAILGVVLVVVLRRGPRSEVAAAKPSVRSRQPIERSPPRSPAGP